MSLSPIYLRSLFVEGNLSLFDYFYKDIGKPLTSNLLTIRPYLSHPTKPLSILKKIFDDRIIDGIYWTNDNTIANPYLDFEIHYHSFVPTHFRVLFSKSTKPREIKVFCGQYYDTMAEISQVLEPDANGIYETNLEPDVQSYCKFFRFQMIGNNIKNENFFDVFDFDMYGDLYSIRGFVFCTHANFFYKKIVMNISLIVLNQ